MITVGSFDLENLQFTVVVNNEEIIVENEPRGLKFRCVLNKLLVNCVHHAISTNAGKWYFNENTYEAMVFCFTHNSHYGGSTVYEIELDLIEDCEAIDLLLVLFETTGDGKYADFIFDMYTKIEKEKKELEEYRDNWQRKYEQLMYEKVDLSFNYEKLSDAVRTGSVVPALSAVSANSVSPNISQSKVPIDEELTRLKAENEALKSSEAKLKAENEALKSSEAKLKADYVKLKTANAENLDYIYVCKKKRNEMSRQITKLMRIRHDYLTLIGKK